MMHTANSSHPPLVRKKDFLWILPLLLAALLLWLRLPTEQGTRAVIRVDGQIRQTLSLSQNANLTFENNGIQLAVTVENGAVFVSESTCPDGLCQKVGSLTAVGQTAVCLPAALSVTVEGESPSIDSTTY